MKKMTAALMSVTIILSSQLCLGDANSPESNSPVASSARQRAFRGGMWRSERVLINHNNGVERMLVSPRLTADINSVWVLPVKCQPGQVKMGIEKAFPQVQASNIKDMAGAVVGRAGGMMIASQLWTIPVVWSFLQKEQTVDFPVSTAADCNGVHIESFTALSPADIERFFKDRGRNIDANELASLAQYTGADYTLIGAWKDGNEPYAAGAAADANQGRRMGRFRSRPCFMIEFPAENPYYPVIRRDSRGPRISVTILGAWQLENASTDAAISQIITDECALPLNFKYDSQGQCTRMPCTSVSIQGPADKIDKLSFVPGEPRNADYAESVLNVPCMGILGMGIAGLAAISYVSAGVSGSLVYRKWRGFATAGLLNILSVIAVALAMNYSKGPMGEAFRADKKKGRMFLICFSLLVVGLSVLVISLLKMPLGAEF